MTSPIINMLNCVQCCFKTRKFYF